MACRRSGVRVPAAPRNEFSKRWIRFFMHTAPLGLYTRSMRRTTSRQLGVALLWCGAITAGGWLWLGGLWAWLIAVNAVAFASYGLDKRRARRRQWRIAEAVLLTLAILGGAAGSVAGQQTFRHKTKKRSFRFLFWLILFLQAAAAGAYLRPWG